MSHFSIDTPEQMKSYLAGQFERAKAALASTDPHDLRSAAVAIHKNFELTPDLLDEVATRLWQDRQTEDEIHIDALAWLCKILGKSESPRYRALLSDIHESATSSKLKKYFKSSLKQLAEVDVEQFEVDKKSVTHSQHAGRKAGKYLNIFLWIE